MNWITRLLASAHRRSISLAAGGIFAVPVLIVSCEPSCAPTLVPRVVEEREVGGSADGRPIIATRVGTAGGVPVLVVGSIHGDEQAGIEIAEHLRDAAAIPDGLDVWVITSVNPDGNANGTRTNARGVDLNRNFPANWEPIDCGAHAPYCSGGEPTSEPETQALVSFVTTIEPRLTVWYHGPDHVVDAALVDGVARPGTLQAYADRVGYPIATVPCAPTVYCTGNATQFINSTISGSSAFVVELSTTRAGGMSTTGVTNHVEAIFAAAAPAEPEPAAALSLIVQR